MHSSWYNDGVYPIPKARAKPLINGIICIEASSGCGKTRRSFCEGLGPDSLDPGGSGIGEL